MLQNNGKLRTSSHNVFLYSSHRLSFITVDFDIEDSQDSLIGKANLKNRGIIDGYEMN